jgi:hypothetical protein
VRAFVGDVRDSGRFAGVKFIAAIAVALLALVGCSSTSSHVSKTPGTTVHTTPDLASSTVPKSTSTPDTVASGQCRGQFGFAEAAGPWVASHLRIVDLLTVKSFRRSKVNADWATARLVGPRRSAVVVAKCVGTTWTIQGGVVIPRAGAANIASLCASNLSLPADLKLCP